MPDRIRVLIVDDIPETRDHLTKLLGFETDIEVVGTAGSGPEAIEAASNVSPDVILMDINMPGMDGITATEQISSKAPAASVIMMSVQGEADYLRRSMLAGAREFLVKPFSSDELTTSIRQVYQRERDKLDRIAERVPAAAAAAARPETDGRIVAVYSPKGGVGRSTIAVNLAIAMHDLGKRVVLVDGSLQFGDVGVMLNLNPKNKSLADLVPEMASGEADSVDSALVTHSSGIEVLLAPPTAETSELVPPPYLRRLLEKLRESHDIVVVDAWPWFNEITLAMLDVADVILAVLTLEITNIKDIRQFLELAQQLGYEDHKVRLVLNRSDSALGIRPADVEQSIGRKIDYSIVSDGRSVVYALNRGVPFVIGNREAQVSQDIVRIARAVSGDEVKASEAARKAAPRKSLLAWR
jgi:pilus assembly protein CpaE